MSTCPTCGQSDLSTRYGKNGPYLAHVEQYPSGRSYFRGLHDSARCAAYTARLTESIEAERARIEAEEFREYCRTTMLAHFGDSHEKFGKGSPEVVALWESQPTEEQMRADFTAAR